MANTKIEYLYRDASNYKQQNIVILAGELSPAEVRTILNNRSDGEYFIPAQVGLPEKRFDEVTEDDHCWFELSEYSFAMTPEEPTVKITTKELVEKFKKIGPYGWDDIGYAPMAEDWDSVEAEAACS